MRFCKAIPILQIRGTRCLTIFSAFREYFETSSPWIYKIHMAFMLKILLVVSDTSTDWSAWACSPTWRKWRKIFEKRSTGPGHCSQQYPLARTASAVKWLGRCQPISQSVLLLWLLTEKEKMGEINKNLQQYFHFTPKSDIKSHMLH